MHPVVPPSVALALLGFGLFAGCIDPAASVDRVPASEAAPVKGRMSAYERTHTWVGNCSPAPSGIQLTQSPVRYCGQHHVWIEGEIDLAELPLVLRNLNGPVELRFSNGPGWNLTITVLTQNHDSEAGVRRTLQNAELQWGHEERGGHFLRASARPKTSPCRSECPSIAILLQLPDNLLVRADLTTTNGEILAGGHQYPSLVARTTNGRVVLRDSITRDVVLDTTNGEIEIRSRPYEHGRWVLDSSNGPIHIELPEATAHGYQLDADTSNGRIDIRLRDGQLTHASRTRQSFLTTDFPDRAIQTRILADTTNGDILVSPYT